MTTVQESITQVVVARLEDITQSNGYSFDVSRVVRQDRKGENVKYEHLSILVEQGATDRAEALDIPGNPPAMAFYLRLDLKCFARDVTAEPRATNENELAMSVIKSITSVGNDWYSMGGNAVDAMFATIEPLPMGDGEMTGCTVPLIVTYRVSETNPYEVRA